MSSTIEAPVTPDQPAPPPTPASFEEFLAWADEDTRAEWVNGEIVVMAPTSIEHVRLADFLLRIMSYFAEEHELGEVLSAPFLMRLSTRPSGREPDLLFVASARVHRRLLNSLESEFGRRRTGVIKGLSPQLPLLTAGASAVAWAQYKGALRTVRGRLTILRDLSPEAIGARVRALLDHEDPIADRMARPDLRPGHIAGRTTCAGD